jgi:hypothetical protein
MRLAKPTIRRGEQEECANFPRIDQNTDTTERERERERERTEGLDMISKPKM